MTMGSRLLAMAILIHLAICAFSEQNNNVNHIISPGSTLSPSMKSKWVSPSGEFAFGFYEISPIKQYLLGIWFDNIPEKTLVWEANRDSPVDNGAALEYTKSGQLILFDSQRRSTWSANASYNKAAAVGAAMLDNGNFVLLDASSQFLWQSFNSPTDTLLPGQTLRWKSAMFSKVSDQNYASGRFKLHMQEDGNLVLYPVERQDQPQGAYWSSDTAKSEANPMRLKVDLNGLLSLVNATNITVKVLNKGYAKPDHYFHRVTLDTDGVLREYVLRDAKAGWSLSWQVMDNPCKVKSACGINGYCVLSEEGKQDCKCPPGFNYIDVQNPFKGCVRNASVDCNGKSRMVELPNTDWLAEADYSYLPSLNQSACQQFCLDDCDCVVVIYGINYCWKKTSPLQDGRQGMDIDRIAYVKVSG